jgi:hypothetical protein
MASASPRCGYQSWGVSLPLKLVVVRTTSCVTVCVYCKLDRDGTGASNPRSGCARDFVNFRKKNSCIARARCGRAGLTVNPPRIQMGDVAAARTHSCDRNSKFGLRHAIKLNYLYCMTKSEFWFSMIPPITRSGNVPSSIPLNLTVLVARAPAGFGHGFGSNVSPGDLAEGKFNTVALIEFASRSLPVKVHLKKKSGGRKTRR